MHDLRATNISPALQRTHNGECDTHHMGSDSTLARPRGLAIWLIIAGMIGWIAAFSLTQERLFLLENPDAAASCDFSLLVQCTANLQSWQGKVFGFPNPLLGVAGWIAPIVVGVGILAGARFSAWFWRLFWVGMAGAFVFVVWLISQSIFVLGTLCPWCMATWAVTIPSFYAVTAHLGRAGLFPLPAGMKKIAASAMTWVPLATILSYGAVILLAQLELNAIPNIGQSLFG